MHSPLSSLRLPTQKTAGWQDVRKAINEGLPKTAIERLDPIIVAAQEAGRYDEAVRAISMKIALEGNIQGNKPEEKIVRMREEIAKAPREMKPALNAVLANWFWHYFQQNRRRFMQRTQTAATPGDDFTTWDLPRILSEIDQQFQITLADEQTLKKTSIAAYDELLEKGSAPDTYRPTLYDVLAHNALQFYSAGEQAGAKSQDAFDLSADSPIFSDTNAFLEWKPQSEDTDSPTLKAIQLYQDLLRFHRNDDDPSPTIDVDLLRLAFGNNHAFGEEKTPRYEAALQRFAVQHRVHPISTRALHRLATVIRTEKDLEKAHEIATIGLRRFRDSVGGKRCFNLIQEIEAREAAVTTERVWNDPAPTIDITYRNISNFHFRLVPYNFDAYIKSNRWSAEQLDKDGRQRMLATRPVKAWSVDLPATGDYQQRVESFPTPDDIEPGVYVLIGSDDPSFRMQDNVINFTQIWVSDLAFVTRAHGGRGLIDGFVLDAKTGHPIAGAKIRAWTPDNRNNRRIEVKPTTTDANGMFRYSSPENRQLFFHASHDGQELATQNYLHSYHSNNTQSHNSTHFFTDRVLYRPGQTIHYKGICFSVDQQDDNYQTIANHDLTVELYDVNGQKVEELKHRTNDYGSFSGSMTAPRDRLMGSMSLRVKGGPRGQTNFRVEEYKRPKFQVAVDPPKAAVKLNDDVRVSGKATAYTGAAINDAKVTWRVTRGVNYPVWWYSRFWWMSQSNGANQEIAHGTTVTQADGTFEIDFVAKPDMSVAESSEPTFRYVVHADVTDTTGETRSSQTTVNLGYTALSASISAANWLTVEDPIDLKIRTTTLSGAGEQASGTIKIHALVQPDKVQRGSIDPRYYDRVGLSNLSNPPPSDPADPTTWVLGDAVEELEFQTDASGSTEVNVKLGVGYFRAKLKTKDEFGKNVTADFQFRVLDPAATKLRLKVPNLFAVKEPSIEPGEQLQCIWGSGYDQARAFVEIIHRGKTVKSYWTDAEATQASIEADVDESMRGGFTVHATLVRENRAYLNSQFINVPWSNKKLTVKWEHFVSKLEPAAKEKWTAIVTGPDAERASAEMVATLYDASLDAFQAHSWRSGFGVFRSDYSRMQMQFQNQLKRLQSLHSGWKRQRRDGTLSYRHFLSEIIQNFYGYRALGRRARFSKIPEMEMEGNAEMAMGMAMDADMDESMAAAPPLASTRTALASSDPAPHDKDDSGNAAPQPDLENVSARKNLNETAFFLPHLIAGEDGTVRIEFTMPEALTEWKFIGFAHDRELRAGMLTSKTVTAKDLMVQPNPPRFLREGDTVEFTVKVSNQSPTRQSGSVRLAFADARTGVSVDDQLGNQDRDLEFEIPAGESKSLAWKISVPDGLGVLTYKAVGSTGRLSDGEEGYLPVLSRRILVTESLPLPIRGKQTKEFEFKRLMESANSDTLQHKSLTVQMVSNPSWYAVMALPYLMEYPHECSEQTFNRLYANAIARHIAGSDPKIHDVFERWRNTPALDSPLEQNQDLKAVMLEETPWVRQASNESQARRNVGILFDDNRLDEETRRLNARLAQLQHPDGAWPWFPGGRANDYITLYITTGYGRMRHLGVDVDPAPAVKSLNRLDAWVTDKYNRIKDRDQNHLTVTIALYLYGRSFFLNDQPVAAQHREAVNYWQQQARKHWLNLSNRQSQAHLAIALKRFGDVETAQAIMRSIKERSVSDEELGMFWREQELSWWWYRAPIETQAMMIEAFDEVMNDAESVEDCKVWLLKQKQTQDWKTTKATADAVYALLLRGTDVLASDALVEITLGGKAVKPEDIEAGTGFFEQRYTGDEIRPDQGNVTLTKVDDGVAWGSLHWQYLEDMSKVTPYEGTPLKLTKQLHVKKNTDKGPTLVPVTGAVEVGDELVVRVVLRCDRDMEYVHLKDYRGSGTEPVNVLSRYKFQDGLAYYESTRDTASHFFIDYLPKGVYVFEYSTRVQLRGNYQTGVASIQCMYAPEFNSHSESLPIEVK